MSVKENEETGLSILLHRDDGFDEGFDPPHHSFYDYRDEIMNVIKLMGVVALMSRLGACGTFSSRKITDNAIRIRGYNVKTHCDEISHVYSGVQYDLCILHSERKPSEPKLQMDTLWLVSVDFSFSR